MRQKTGSVKSRRSVQQLPKGINDDRGAGSILALAIVAVCVFALSMIQVVGGQFIRLAHTRSAADAIAIAAADSLRGLSTGYPCEVARKMSLQAGVVLDECRIADLQVFVRVHSETLGLSLRAKARAGIVE